MSAFLEMWGLFHLKEADFPSLRSLAWKLERANNKSPSVLEMNLSSKNLKKWFILTLFLVVGIGAKGKQ